MNCLICAHPIPTAFYQSQTETSISSLCKIVPGATTLYFCDNCGHLETKPNIDLARYYDTEYKVFTNTEEEDLIYKVLPNRVIFREEHQLETLLSNFPLTPSCRVLDYGCAKGGFLKKLYRKIPSVEGYLFDVSRDYLPFWKTFTPENRYANYRMPSQWQNTFDLVMSFFVFEHLTSPMSTFAEIAGVLKEHGTLYFVVPNFQENLFDFVVAEHINHFSEGSIRHALSRSGFEDIQIDTTSHTTAFVVMARKSGGKAKALCATRSEIEKTKGRALEISQFMSRTFSELRKFQKQTQGRPSAVYGAGFYGSIIMSSIENQDDVTCFIDQNPHLIGRTHFNKPIMAPRDLPPPVECIYVGLNPATARENISQISAWNDRKLEFFFL